MSSSAAAKTEGELPLPHKRRLAVRIARTLSRAGHESYFVGGCVRDLVMRRRPSDFDIATSATPDEIERIFPRTVPVGRAFGVMMVLQENHPFEVATFRKDAGYSDGRRPDRVEFADAKADCLRRDFTANGLYYNPLERRTNRRVIDWVGGVDDIQKKIIRTIGDPYLRFEEDKLRLLRAVRFASNLGFEIEARTFEAARKLAPEIKQVSAERVRDELVKMFTGPRPAAALDWLDRTCLLKEVLPEIEALKGVEQPPEFHPEGDVFKHTRLMLDFLKKPDPVLAFGCLLHDIGKPATFSRGADRIRFNGHDRVGARMTEGVMDRLRFSNEMKKRITACVEWHMQFKDVRAMRPATLKRMFQRETFLTELEQHRYDCLASHGNLSAWRYARRRFRELSAQEIRPEPHLKGGDLIELGLKPGPEFGKILKEAEELQLEGRLDGRDAALAWARIRILDV